jgi:hypothetical protein
VFKNTAAPTINLCISLLCVPVHRTFPALRRTCNTMLHQCIMANFNIFLLTPKPRMIAAEKLWHRTHEAKVFSSPRTCIGLMLDDYFIHRHDAWLYMSVEQAQRRSNIVMYLQCSIYRGRISVHVMIMLRNNNAMHNQHSVCVMRITINASFYCIYESPIMSPILYMCGAPERLFPYCTHP